MDRTKDAQGGTSPRDPNEEPMRIVGDDEVRDTGDEAIANGTRARMNSRSDVHFGDTHGSVE